MSAEALPPPERESARRPDLRDAATVQVRVHSLGGRRFVQTPEALQAHTKEGQLYDLLPGQLAVTRAAQLRDLTADRTPESVLTDTVFQVAYHAPGTDRLSTLVSVADLDAREPQWPDQLGIRPHTTKRNLETIGVAVRAVAATLRADVGWTYGYACTGPVRLEGGEWAWLRPGKAALTATGTDDRLTAEIPRGIGAVQGVAVLDMDDPSPAASAAEDLEALLRVLDLVPDQPEIPLALLAQLAWAPFSALPDLGRIAVAVAGDTGSRKTAISGAIIAAQSSTFSGGRGVEVPVTIKMRHNQSTVFAADQVLHPLSGLVGTVDDWFAGRMTAKEIAEAWKRLSAIGDNTATGSGGARGGYRNGQGVVARQVFPRCCVLATAERFPEEGKHSSETARYVALELAAPVNLAVLSEIQRDGRPLSRAHAAMIQASLGDLDRVYAALEWGKQVAESWPHGGHGRVTYGYARLLGGAYLLAERMRELLEVDPAPMLEHAADLMAKAASEQTRRSGIRKGRDIARDPVALWTKHLRQALAGEPFWAADVRRGDAGHYLPPQIPGYGAHALGWRQGSEVLIPAGKGDPVGAVVAYVPGESAGRPPWRPLTLRLRSGRWQEIYDVISARVVAEDGWSLPASADLRARLVDAGYLKSATAQNEDLWDGRPRCYVLDLGKLLEGEEEDCDPGQEAGGVPADSPPAPAAPVPPAVVPEVCPACGLKVDAAVRDLFGGLHPMCAPDEPMPAPAPAVEPAPAPAVEPAPEPQSGPESAVEPAPAPSPSKAPQGRTGPQKAPYVRRSYAHRAAVLDVTGLHLAGAASPQECPLPASKSAALALADHHDIKQLWITPRAAHALGLPTVDDHADVPTDAGVPHAWADDNAIQGDPVGVAPWMVVWPRGATRDKGSRSIVLPHLETRAAWTYDGEGNPRDLEPATLLRAVELLADALGADYYWSPNATSALLARRHCRKLGESLSRTILAGAVPPAVGYSKMLASKWQRPLTPQERKDRAVIRLDRNAAYLSAMNIPLGMGDPTYTDGPRALNRKLAGYWRIAQAPTGLDALLPELRFKPARDGHLWLTTPDAALLEDLGVLPEITAAWVWEDSRKVLASLYDTIRVARLGLLKGKVAGDPAAAVAHALTADLYKSFTGYLARAEGPRAEDKRGPDLLWRPDWRDQILAEAGARMYRNLLAADRRPIASYVDAAYFTTSETDPIAARPGGLAYDHPTKPTGRGGSWKNEGLVLLENLGHAPGTPKFHDRFTSELKKGRREP
ncbi:hypothetical protein [Nonomuraea sp. NPDC050310]|uniref:hypothetical protein n=1 Tax=Nonomuraea sp. NPDC050310 TaxID=3154935 RepID=UPI0033E50BE4